MGSMRIRAREPLGCVGGGTGAGCATRQFAHCDASCGHMYASGTTRACACMRCVWPCCVTPQATGHTTGHEQYVAGVGDREGVCVQCRAPT